MEKKRYTVIALFLIAAMMSACLLTACFGRKVLFSCDPDNADNISKILLYSDRDQLSLNLLNGKLQTRIVVSTEGVCGPLRGPLTTTFRITSQSYDKESRCWSEPVQETGDLTIYQ